MEISYYSNMIRIEEFFKYSEILINQEVFQLNFGNLLNFNETKTKKV